MTTVGHSSALVYDSAPPPVAVFNAATGIAHGSTFAPGQTTRATFEFANSGPGQWPSGCYFKCTEGENFGIFPTSLPRAQPRERVPLQLDFTMPYSPGMYAGAFRLVCGAGFFSPAVWVVVTVTAGAPAQGGAGSDTFQSLAGTFSAGNDAGDAGANPVYDNLFGSDDSGSMSSDDEGPDKEAAEAHFARNSASSSSGNAFISAMDNASQSPQWGASPASFGGADHSFEGDEDDDEDDEDSL